MAMSDEHKKAISIAKKGKKSSPETIKKLSEYHLKNPIKYWLGKKFSEQHLDNLRKSQIGRKHSEEVKQKISIGNKGKTVSTESRVKMSISQKGKSLGEKNPNWRGGKSYEPYSIDWKNSLKIVIRERDKYTCQLCGEKQGEFSFPIHHIDYDKKNCNPDNLITLCRVCHSKTNYKREYWLDYFKNKLNLC